MLDVEVLYCSLRWCGVLVLDYYTLLDVWNFGFGYTKREHPIEWLPLLHFVS